MNNLIITKTDSTPGVILDSAKNHIEFNGDSRPENVKQFFEPIFDWINEYEKFLAASGNSTKIDVYFKLEYFNSSSAKYIIDLIKLFSEMSGKNPKITSTINWCHDEDDDDMLDTGKEFVKITGINMNFLAS